MALPPTPNLTHLNVSNEKRKTKNENGRSLSYIMRSFDLYDTWYRFRKHVCVLCSSPFSRLLGAQLAADLTSGGTIRSDCFRLHRLCPPALMGKNEPPIFMNSISTIGELV